MLCEWNPQYDTERGELSPEGDCANQATVVVGPLTARYRLCSTCAARPYFRMFVERVPLGDFDRVLPEMLERRRLMKARAYR